MKWRKWNWFFLMAVFAMFLATTGCGDGGGGDKIVKPENPEEGNGTEPPG